MSATAVFLFSVIMFAQHLVSSYAAPAATESEILRIGRCYLTDDVFVGHFGLTVFRSRTNSGLRFEHKDVPSRSIEVIDFQPVLASLEKRFEFQYMNFEAKAHELAVAVLNEVVMLLVETKQRSCDEEKAVGYEKRVTGGRLPRKNVFRVLPEAVDPLSAGAGTAA